MSQGYHNTYIASVPQSHPKVIRFSPGRNLQAYSTKKDSDKKMILLQLIKMYVASYSLVKAFSCLCMGAHPKRSKSMKENLIDIHFRGWKWESLGSPRHSVGFCSWQVGQAFTVRMTLMSAFHIPASRGYAFRMIQAIATPVSVGLDLW